MSEIVDVNEARSALRAIDPGSARSQWVKVGMAAKAAGLTVDEFISWSSTADNFAGARDCHSIWRSFKSEGIGPASLFQLAREAGWRPEAPPEPSRRNARPAAPNRRKPASPAKVGAPTTEHDMDRAEAIAAREDSAKMLKSMMTIIERASFAPENHPYLVRKGVSRAGLFAISLAELKSILLYSPKAGKRGKLEGDSILLAPMYGEGGAIANLEMIDPDGRKSMLPLPRSGCMWHAETIESDQRVIGLCEGIATAKTLSHARRHPVVAAGAANNMPKVAARLRQIAPGAEIHVFGDLGEDGEKYAREAADAVYGVLIQPDRNIVADGDDFNDMLAKVGDDALAAYLDARCVNPQRITFRQAEQRVHIDYVLPGLPIASVGLVVGPGSVGKSFLSLELGISVALGFSLPGIPGDFAKPVQGRVAMVFGEDDRAVINNRMHDVAKFFRLTDDQCARLDNDLVVLSLVGEDMRVTQTDNRSVTDGVFLEKLRLICSGRRLVFVDPLVRLHDADENDNTAASHLMLAIARIARDTHCAIVLLHHSGKGDREGWAAARGASAITTTARWQLNITNPTKEEIENFHLKDNARLWVKADGVKMNYSDSVRGFWLKRETGGVLVYKDPQLSDDAFGDGPLGPSRAGAAGSQGAGSQRPKGYQAR